MLPPVNPERDAVIDEMFADSMRAFDAASVVVCRVTDERTDRNIEQRMGWADGLFVRLGVSMNSTKMLIDDGLQTNSFDHFAIASLARTIVDASLMILYLSVPTMSKDEWRLRRGIIDLHDATKRCKIAEYNLGLDNALQKGKLRAAVKHYNRMFGVIKESIRSTKAFKELDAQQKKHALDGEHIFVRGKNTAIREAGFTRKDYDYLQDRLSAYVHSLPESFHVADLYGVDFTRIVTYQKEIAYHALMGIARFSAASAERMEDIHRRVDEYLFDDDDYEFEWLDLPEEPAP